jgi:hypothetical protein
MLRPQITNVFTTNFLSHHRFVCGANDASVEVSHPINDGRVSRTRDVNHHIRKVSSSFVVDENTFVTRSYDETVRLFHIRETYRNTESDIFTPLTESDLSYEGRLRLGIDFDQSTLHSQANGELIAPSVIGGDIHVFDANELVDLARLPPPPNIRNIWSVVDGQQQGGAPEQVSPANGQQVPLVGHRSERTIKTWRGCWAND